MSVKTHHLTVPYFHACSHVVWILSVRYCHVNSPANRLTESTFSSRPCTGLFRSPRGNQVSHLAARWLCLQLRCLAAPSNTHVQTHASATQTLITFLWSSTQKVMSMNECRGFLVFFHLSSDRADPAVWQRPQASVLTTANNLATYWFFLPHLKVLDKHLCVRVCVSVSVWDNRQRKKRNLEFPVLLMNAIWFFFFIINMCITISFPPHPRLPSAHQALPHPLMRI